ncbi:SNF2-related protein [Blastococcus brunescens]|uniref:SNF2-related protein n=1 Tax=Blastococcus brunescens TaxID=1564165 RepID=A0ABZ1B751_9ACTN|nr:SNF2-related protein [Blastococcus sp. BMG 8361]WRL66569.1 SNF2-related protein [Blastococcus sp. BMG 8361]
MARRGQRQTSTRRPAPRDQRRGRDRDDVISVIARAVREVEAAVQRGRVTPAVRTKFQAVALLMREEHTRVKADESLGDARRAEQLKRLDGVATILAKTAVRDTGLLSLLAEDAVVSDAARTLTREMLRAVGMEPPRRRRRRPNPPRARPPPAAGRSAVGHLAAAGQPVPGPGLRCRPADRGAPPSPGRVGADRAAAQLVRAGGRRRRGPHAPARAVVAARRGGRELMPHQAQVVAAAADGHRTFLLADEPGLGKTAQALLAAEAANAYPLLVVVPSVVKTNWAREAGIWTPHRPTTVVHGNGDSIDGFADIVVVNYEVLDRHVGWFGDFGFRGMVVDEAHFIKNKSSQRSQHVLELSDRIRSRFARPLMMALTGTPLINDIDDFRAIWQFLGWIDESKPLGELMEALEETGLTPADFGFYAAARRCVVDLGIVRRRKVDVAADIPARRIADLPVELDGAAGRSIRAAEQELARRMVTRYETALANRSGDVVEGIDRDLVRRVARSELKDATTGEAGENVFSMMRRIGRAKAGLAADYAAQLARSAGRSSSSPSTWTSWMPPRRPSPGRASGSRRSGATRRPRRGRRTSTRS